MTQSVQAAKMLAAALEQAKWRLPPAVGELMALLSRSATALCRAAAAGSDFSEARQAESLHRCAAQLTEGQLECTPEGRAALDSALASVSDARSAFPMYEAWFDAVQAVLTAIRRLGTPVPLAHSVTSAQAEILCDAVLARARTLGLRLVAAVCDDGGQLLAMRRDDDAFIASIDIAINKAYTSVALKMPTKALAELAAPGGSLYGIQHTNQGRIVIFGGGVPIERDGRILGGFGVSGGTAEQDTEMGDFAAALAARICSPDYH